MLRILIHHLEESQTLNNKMVFFRNKIKINLVLNNRTIFSVRITLLVPSVKIPTPLVKIIIVLLQKIILSVKLQILSDKIQILLDKIKILLVKIQIH